MSLTACGNGGHIDFQPETTTTINRPAPFNMVPGSQAQVVQIGKTVSNGYSAKIQLNDKKGTTLTSGDGTTARIKYTTRNR